MAQVVTAVAVFALAGYLLWRYADRLFEQPGVKVAIRLDRPEPGSHLVWDLVNTSPTPITLTKLAVRGRSGAGDSVPADFPKTLAPQDHLILTTDVDWSLLAARSIGVVDATGREHQAARAQLTHVQTQLHQLIDRRVYPTSARDFLAGAADLAFGVVILGLGFFMLMWVIATG